MSVNEPPKKRKHHDPDSPSKRAKLHHFQDEPASKPVKDKSKSKDKIRHKPKSHSHEDKPLDDDFAHLRATLTVSIPPKFADHPGKGVNQMLDSLVMKYSSALEGVLVSHSNTTFFESAGVLIAESPFTTARVSFDALVWRPRIGMRLRGSISLCGPDHVGLILHRTFNCSIPRWGLDEGIWEFVAGPWDGEDESALVDGGWWRTKIGSEALGGLSRRLDFTVVGLTIANQMLSLTGSLHEDPFDPGNLPSEGSLPEKSTAHRPAGIHEPDFEDPTEPFVGSMLEDDHDINQDVDMDSADEGDPFDALASLAKQRQEVVQQGPVESKKEKKSKKRKRKEEEAEQIEMKSQGEQVLEEGKKKKKKRKAEQGAPVKDGNQEEEPKKKKRKKHKDEAGQS